MPTVPPDLTQQFRRRLPTEYLALVAMVSLAMVIPGQPSSSMLAIIGTGALAAAVISRWSDTDEAFTRAIRLAGFAVVVLSAYSFWMHSNPDAELVLRPLVVELAWSIPLVMIAGWVLYAVHTLDTLSERAFRVGVVACLVALTWVVAAQSASSNLSTVPYIDVHDMHIEGAKHLWNGENPFTETVVRDSNPYTDDDAVIEGYFYTPSVLVTYSLSWRLLGDARWASVIAIAVFLGMLLWPTLKASRRLAVGTIALVSVFVANPSFEFMINRAWTDLLALPFLLGSAVAWRKHPVASALLLGAALSTKEYFIVFLPVLLLVAYPDRWKRLAYAGAVVVATYIPFALWDPVVLIPRAIKLVDTDRPDSLGLVGYGLSIPVWLSLAATIVAAVYLSRRVDTLPTMFVVFAAVLSVIFVTGVQAFVNYWVAVTGVVLIGLWLWLRQLDESETVTAADRRGAVA